MAACKLNWHIQLSPNQDIYEYLLIWFWKLVRYDIFLYNPIIYTFLPDIWHNCWEDQRDNLMERGGYAILTTVVDFVGHLYTTYVSFAVVYVPVSCEISFEDLTTVVHECYALTWNQ